MKIIMGLDPARVDGIAACFVSIRDGMITVGQAAAETGRALEAMRARLPRSFTSVDAMHWTPPADGEAVPPCLA